MCHPPVDVDFYRPGPERRGDFLLAVGALVPYKRYEEAIAAARRAGRPLVIVGGGPEEKRLRALADSSVQFLVNRSAEELRSLYRTCAYFVQPGEEDFGIAAVEALACGAPVVALGRGGVRDIVADGATGVLYEPADPAGLAGALERASRIEFDYTALSESALPFRTERFREEFKNEVESLLRDKAES